MTEEVLDQRILRDLQKFRLKQMGNALSELLPRRLIDAVLKLADIPAEIPAAAAEKSTAYSSAADNKKTASHYYKGKTD